MFKSDIMIINGVDMNIKLPCPPTTFYPFTPSDETKVRINILDATAFITQVELKHPLHLAHANILGMKRKLRGWIQNFPE